MNKRTFYPEQLNLRLFDGNINTNVTTDSGLSVEMKVFYSDYLIDNAVPKLVHDQFGQKKPIPQGKGKTVEFRKYSPLPKALRPLTEGVTPDGNKLNVTNLTATVQQFGDYIALSDILLMTAIDNNLVEATKILGNQAGATLDTITREVINAGTNKICGARERAARYLLVGGDSTPANNDYLSVLVLKKGVRWLKAQNTQKIDGYYIGIANPDTLFDLMCDPEWISANQYAGSRKIFEGEVGEIAGVRFVETTEAKVFAADNLTAAARNLTVKTANATDNVTVAVKELITAADALALVGRKVLIGTTQYEIEEATAAAAGSASIKLKVGVTVAADAVIYPGEAGSQGRSVYSTLLLGDNAYGVTEIEGGGLKHIVKQLGSAGTSDPLDQRATVGWKATKTAEILVDAYMVRIETASTFAGTGN